MQKYAAVAQLVEQLTRNEQVVRSSRISSSIKSPFLRAFLYVELSKQHLNQCRTFTNIFHRQAYWIRPCVQMIYVPEAFFMCGYI